MNKRIYITIFILCFVIYNLNFTTIGSADSIPTSLLPFNILSGHGIYFDEYYTLLKDFYGNMYFFERYNGHYVSSFPLISGLLVTPIYIPFYLYLKVHSLDVIVNFYNYAFLVEKISASIIAALSVALFYKLMYQISKNFRISTLFTLLFGFATQTFSISSQALWQHGTANLFLIMSEIYFMKAVNTEVSQRKNGLLSIIFAVLSFASRNVFLLFVLPIVALLIYKIKKGRHVFMTTSLLLILMVIFYNVHFYHSLLGSYSYQINNINFRNLPQAFAGLFFSPSRGAIFYTPFYIFSFWTLFIWSKIKKGSLVPLFL